MSDPHLYPKVLVISANPFAYGFNNSVILIHLFTGWPRQNLAQIYVRSLADITPCQEICSSYWEMTPFKAFLTRFGIRSSGNPASLQRPATGNRAKGAKRGRFGVSLVNAAKRFVKSHLRWLAEPLREFAMDSRHVVTDDLEKWAKSFKPQIIYAVVGSLHMARLALELSRRLGVPFVCHITDDWVPALYRKCIFSAYLRAQTEDAFRQLFLKASCRMAIGKDMADEYAQRYGLDFTHFMNCVDAAKFSPWTEEHPNRKELVFTYMGGLSNRRIEVLIKIAEILEEISGEQRSCALRVYTQNAWVEQYGKALSKFSVTQVVRCLSEKEIPAALIDSDVLLMIESFDAELSSFLRLSVSTKVPEYLCAGRCIFAVGPGTIASHHYIDELKAGHVVDSNDSQVIKRSLLKIVVNDDYRRQTGARARQAALERHESGRERKRFRDVLSQKAVPAFDSVEHNSTELSIRV